jgi:hypothetical protein
MIASIQNNLDLIIFTFIVIWSLTWSGIAMWRAAQNQNKVWFSVIFVSLLGLGFLGTTGILYLCFFSKEVHVHTKA